MMVLRLSAPNCAVMVELPAAAAEPWKLKDVLPAGIVTAGGTVIAAGFDEVRVTTTSDAGMASISTVNPMAAPSCTRDAPKKNVSAGSATTLTTADRLTPLSVAVRVAEPTGPATSGTSAEL